MPTKVGILNSVKDKAINFGLFAFNCR